VTIATIISSYPQNKPQQQSSFPLHFFKPLYETKQEKYQNHVISSAIWNKWARVNLSKAKKTAQAHHLFQIVREKSYDLILVNNTGTTFSAWCYLFMEARNSVFELGVYLLKSKSRIEDKLRFPWYDSTFSTYDQSLFFIGFLATAVTIATVMHSSSF